MTPTARSAYRIETPFTVSFSGGRTSGFMLAKIIEAHGGALPERAVVTFCNTGLEHEGTLRFVGDCAERFAVPIMWLEYRVGKTFAVVDYCSASRNGEPFTALIADRKYLPNPVTRFCTTELKILTIRRYLESLGWSVWNQAVGLRADEPHRVARIKGDRQAENVVCPVAQAGHTLMDVRAYWAASPFDLDLPNNDNAFGNCMGCFLKGRVRLDRVALAKPEAFDWWIEREAAMGNTFRNDRPTYHQMLTQMQVQGRFVAEPLDDTMPCTCHD